MLGHGGSSAGSYLANPTSPIPSHCAVIILFQSVPVHQLSRLALLRTSQQVISGTKVNGVHRKQWQFYAKKSLSEAKK